MKYKNASMETVDVKIRELLRNSSLTTEEQGFLMKKGLFLFGVTGSGKTYTLYAIKNHFQSFNFQSFNSNSSNVENWVELLTEIKDRIAEKKSIKYTIEHITGHNFVFLDDVGAEKSTEWVQETLYLIIDRCYRNEKTLFITTNLSMEEFSVKYGDRLLSRICGMCDTYEMPKIDKRVNE